MKEIFKRIIVAILTFEARMLIKRTKPTIIAITGNVGKTSTKDAIFSVLKHTQSTRKSEKSFNSEIGVPLTVLGLDNAWSNPFLWFKNILDGFLLIFFHKGYPEVLVLEMGVDRPGDMAKLCSWIRPDVVVLTRLPEVPTHVEYFSSPEAVVQEKMTLARALKPDGILVYNHDDETIRREIENIRQKAIGFSRYSLSHFTASGDNVIYKDGIPYGVEFAITHLDTVVRVTVEGSLGVQHAYNFAAAMAVGVIFDVTPQVAAAHLSEYTTPPGRMRVIEGLKGTLIIDDTYNSSPTAAERALLTLKELRGHKRKIAVLGDMLELGQFSVNEHEKLGALAASCCGMLVTVGVRARKIADGALENGLSEKHIYQYETAEQASTELQTMMREGDMILVKASQGVRGERIVEEIMADPSQAPDLLVRQGAAWRRKA